VIYTLTQAADAIRRFPGRMEVLDTIPTGETSGIVLSRRIAPASSASAPWTTPGSPPPSASP
jgi:hypothetical protein